MFDSGVLFHSDRRYQPIAKSGSTTVGGYGTLTLLTNGITGTPPFLVAFSDGNGIMRSSNVGTSGISFINDGNLWYFSKGSGTCLWRVYGY